MKKIVLGLVVLVVSIVMLSCATTKISSFTNPDINISDYKKILVYGNSRDIDFRKTLEADLVNAFAEKQIDVASHIDLISPLKEYTKSELQEIYLENNIDCILEVAVLDASTGTAYVPQQSYTNYSSQWVNGQLISIPYTTTSGGYSVSYPKGSFEIILTDAKTDEVALKATANSEGDEFSDMKTISKSLAKKIVEEYLAQR